MGECDRLTVGRERARLQACRTLFCLQPPNCERAATNRTRRSLRVVSDEWRLHSPTLTILDPSAAGDENGQDFGEHRHARACSQIAVADRKFLTTRKFLQPKQSANNSRSDRRCTRRRRFVCLGAKCAYRSRLLARSSPPSRLSQRLRSVRSPQRLFFASQTTTTTTTMAPDLARVYAIAFSFANNAAFSHAAAVAFKVPTTTFVFFLALSFNKPAFVGAAFVSFYGRRPR